MQFLAKYNFWIWKKEQMNSLYASVYLDLKKNGTLDSSLQDPSLHCI